MTETTPPPSLSRCTMDGPALADVAYQVGLAPDAVHESTTAWDGTRIYWVSLATMWAPWQSLAQADAVLRSLRAAWLVRTEAYGSAGLIRVSHGDTGWEIAAPWGHDGGDTEPLAILRCAVRARCWERREGEKHER